MVGEAHSYRCLVITAICILHSASRTVLTGYCNDLCCLPICEGISLLKSYAIAFDAVSSL
ncbi:hypothetical protein PF005_g6704 [Phytophthora fragariae]|uniref:Uncharacterized protein n=2 Tax=Phytophthora TaxID=4783 RepID=A0A6A3STP8_9STRA|nr:hypothetical protein PF003_g10053 [Phytophthora fragariae]KAE9042514.1 hypothetical protein PR002_g3857 [Phytophthora rubi]KAE8942808.1 hypothetical protein PF009_g7446 [Phytophthora fragariae]KAE9020358.1 hypothetical protein PF011_g5432 [Phytophthora fragariae]KAE9047607.1 hypothetical protein PR001_g4125 [Phytophthora rubi]